MEDDGGRDAWPERALVPEPLPQSLQESPVRREAHERITAAAQAVCCGARGGRHAHTRGRRVRAGEGALQEAGSVS